MSQERHSDGMTVWYRLGSRVKKSRMWTPPQRVWKIVEAAEKCRREVMYSSALEKSEEKGRGVDGAILDDLVDEDLDRLADLDESCFTFRRGKTSLMAW